MSNIFHMVSNAGPFLVKLLVAMLVFSVIVIFHELGHFLLAKRNGIGVVEFSLGMGPRLISTVKGETRYSVKLLLWRFLHYGRRRRGRTRGEYV